MRREQSEREREANIYGRARAAKEVSSRACEKPKLARLQLQLEKQKAGTQTKKKEMRERTSTKQSSK